jgi:hypothetical protein
MIPSTQSWIRHKYRNQLLATPASKEIKVLMIGNNPREMGCLSIHLRNFKWKRFAVNATFDLKEGWRIAQYFKPDYILIDGSLGERLISDFIDQVRQYKSTRMASVALLKEDSSTQLMIPGVQDYLLKENIVSDTFAYDVLNGIVLKMHEDEEQVYSLAGSHKVSWLPASTGIEKKVVIVN